MAYFIVLEVFMVKVRLEMVTINFQYFVRAKRQLWHPFIIRMSINKLKKYCKWQGTLKKSVANSMGMQIQTKQFFIVISIFSSNQTKQRVFQLHGKCSISATAL
jgi:hypothetical protein